MPALWQASVDTDGFMSTMVFACYDPLETTGVSA
jgi:hypothetical protein